MTAEPVLYSFRRCPFAMRARMALDVSGTHVEHREVALRNKPQAMLDASPKGTVPVLVLPDGHVIDESLDIMVHALDRHDPDNWLRNKSSDRKRAIAFLDDFKEKLDRYKYASRYDPDAKRGDVDLAERRNAMDVLRDFSKPLENSPYFGGTTPCLLDIATFPFVRQFANVEPEWWAETASEGLRSWLTRLVESDRFVRIMTKHELWTDSSAR